MGEIVEFRGPRRDRAPHVRGMIEGSAQILFFTGVRYMRIMQDGDMPPAAPRRPKGRGRGWVNGLRGKRTKPS
jgi:hypothetical protein